MFVLLSGSRSQANQSSNVDVPNAHEVVEELRDGVHFLERQVEVEREARRHADTLLARQMDRVPESEAPVESEDRESDPSPRPYPYPTDAGTGAQERPQRRSWWRRVFGD